MFFVVNTESKGEERQKVTQSQVNCMIVSDLIAPLNAFASLAAIELVDVFLNLSLVAPNFAPKSGATPFKK